MGRNEQQEWDARYRAADRKAKPCQVLEENRHLLPGTGKALDLACGLGGNALLLARLGLETTGWDISQEAISGLQRRAHEAAVSVRGQVRDVVASPPAPNSFDVICISHFLDRALTRRVSEALVDGGVLFYQTFAGPKSCFGGPGNPAFRLDENELLRLFVPPLRLRFYREEAHLGAAGRASWGLAMLVAQRL